MAPVLTHKTFCLRHEHLQIYTVRFCNALFVVNSHCMAAQITLVEAQRSHVTKWNPKVRHSLTECDISQEKHHALQTQTAMPAETRHYLPVTLPLTSRYAGECALTNRHVYPGWYFSTTMVRVLVITTVKGETCIFDRAPSIRTEIFEPHMGVRTWVAVIIIICTLTLFSLPDVTAHFLFSSCNPPHIAQSNDSSHWDKKKILQAAFSNAFPWIEMF